MDTFYQVFGFVAALCLGIIILAVFFTGLNYFKRATRGYEIIKLKGFIKEGKFVNIHLKDGKIHSELRFVGFSDQSADKIPHQLSKMVVCETVKEAKIFFRADVVKIIEEVENIS